MNLKASKTSFLVPNLENVMNGWYQGCNPNVELLRNSLTKDFTRMELDETKFQSLCDHDYGLLYSVIYSGANRDSLEHMARLTMWLIMLDDMVDNANGSMYHDEGQIVAYINRLRDVVAQTLALRKESVPSEPDEFLSKFLKFSPFLSKLKPELKSFFYNSICEYLDAIVEEHRINSSKIKLSAAEYMKVRRGTICMIPILTIAELIMPATISEKIDIDPSTMVPLWSCLRDIMIYVNDLDSCQNDLEGDTPNSIQVFNSYHSDCQIGVYNVVEKLGQAVSSFDREVKQFLKLHDEAELHIYFRYLRAIPAGFHNWCVKSGRYQISTGLRDDGSFKVELQKP